MRAITVRQPWAWAIIDGGKDVENRTRNIAGAYRGPIAIHAAMSHTFGARTDPNIAREITEAGHEADFLRWLTSAPHGAVVGLVDLVDVHHANDVDPTFCGICPEGCCGCSPWAMPEHYHLVLANPRPLPEPIPWRGALGLWNLPDDALRGAA